MRLQATTLEVSGKRACTHRTQRATIAHAQHIHLDYRHLCDCQQGRWVHRCLAPTPLGQFNIMADIIQGNALSPHQVGPGQPNAHAENVANID